MAMANKQLTMPCQNSLLGMNSTIGKLRCQEVQLKSLKAKL